MLSKVDNGWGIVRDEPRCASEGADRPARLDIAASQADCNFALDG
jgi:hypothetical protein